MAEEFNNPINNLEKSENENKQKDKFVIRPLRTYEEDVANFVKRGQISTAKIIAAEQKRQRETKMIKDIGKTKKKMALVILASIGLLIMSVLVIWGVYYFMSSRKNSSGTDRPSGFGEIIINKKAVIEIDSDYKVPSEIKTQVIRNIDVPPADINDGEIVEIMVTETTSLNVGDEKKEIKRKIDINRLFEYMELNPDDSFMRALDENYLFGLMKLGGETFPIILIKTLEFQRVYSGMLDWERILYREINDIFFKTLGKNDFVKIIKDDNGNEFDITKFMDRVFYNKDVRVIENQSGQVLFYYTFVNNDHLLLSSNTAAIENLAQKLNLQNIVR